MISDTSHLFKQLQLDFCLKEKKEKKRSLERQSRREGFDETKGEIYWKGGEWPGKQGQGVRSAEGQWSKKRDNWNR